jgi:hypothetical protein
VWRVRDRCRPSRAEPNSLVHCPGREPS